MFDIGHHAVRNCTSALILKAELEPVVEVEGVTVSDQSITSIKRQFCGFDYDGKPDHENATIWQINAGENFREFFGLEMA